MFNEMLSKEYQLGYQEMLRIGVSYLGSVRDNDFVQRTFGDELFKLYAQHKLKKAEHYASEVFSALGMAFLYLKALSLSDHDIDTGKMYSEKGVLHPKVPDLIRLPQDVDFKAIELLKLCFLANALELKNCQPLILFGTLTAEALLQQKYQHQTPKKFIRSVHIAKKMAELKMKELKHNPIEKGNVWYRLKLFLEVVGATFPSMHDLLFPQYALFEVPFDDEDTKPSNPYPLEFIEPEPDEEDTQPNDSTRPLLPPRAQL